MEPPPAPAARPATQHDAALNESAQTTDSASDITADFKASGISAAAADTSAENPDTAENVCPVDETATETVEPPEEPEEDPQNFLLCTEAIPAEDSVDEPTAPAPTNENSSAPVAPASNPPAREAPTTRSTRSSETARVVLPPSEIEFVTSTLAPRSKPGSLAASRRTSPSQSRGSPVHLPAYSQEALRDLVCATLAPAAAANLIKSEKREKKTAVTEAPVEAGPSGVQGPASPQPGASGLQPRSDLAAPDLQLDCLSSDTEDSSSEDVQVVKISRRRKTNSSKPPVEVDLTQEMTSDDDDITVEEVRSRTSCQQEAQEQEEENKPENSDLGEMARWRDGEIGEIAIATFASVQQQLGEQANIQSSSRGSTPGVGLLAPPPAQAMEQADGAGRVAGDHSHYTMANRREVGLLMEVPGVRRMEERPEERRRRVEERREERRQRGLEDLMELVDGEEEARPGAGEHLEFRPRRLRHPWPEEEGRRCTHPGAPPGCPPAPGGCPCVRRSQEYGPYGGHNYATPPPAHRYDFHHTTFFVLYVVN